jgi:hypothetical protein
VAYASPAITSNNVGEEIGRMLFIASEAAITATRRRFSRLSFNILSSPQ